MTNKKSRRTSRLIAKFMVMIMLITCINFTATAAGPDYPSGVDEDLYDRVREASTPATGTRKAKNDEIVMEFSQSPDAHDTMTWTSITPIIYLFVEGGGENYLAGPFSGSDMYGGTASAPGDHKNITQVSFFYLKPIVETYSVTVNKAWQDYDGETISKPSGLTWTVTAAVGESTYSLNQDSTTNSVTFHVPKGESFTVVESPSATGYSAVSGIGEFHEDDLNDDGILTVVNRSTTDPNPGYKTYSVTVQKAWQDYDGDTISEPSGLTWTVTATVPENPPVVAYSILSAENTYSFNQDSEVKSVTFDVPQGQSFTVEESPRPAGYSPILGIGEFDEADLTGGILTVVNKSTTKPKDEEGPVRPTTTRYDVRIEKVWQDANGDPISEPEDVNWEVTATYSGNDYTFNQSSANKYVTFSVIEGRSFSISETTVPEGYTNISGTGTFRESDLVNGRIRVVNRQDQIEEDLPDEETPGAPVEVEPEIEIPAEEIPAAPVELPKTGGIPLQALITLGGLMMGSGITLKSRKRK